MNLPGWGENNSIDFISGLRSGGMDTAESGGEGKCRRRECGKRQLELRSN